MLYGEQRAHPSHAATVGILMLLTVSILAGCGSSAPTSGADITAAPPSTEASAAAVQAEARQLIDPTGTGKVTDAQVDCVARSVVGSPLLEEAASNMANVPSKDLRQAVMTAYLHCAYDFVLDLYISYAPATMPADQRACVRAQYTKLTVDRLSEVIVQDPDAANTGPLVIAGCTGQSNGSDPFAGIGSIPATP